MVNKISFKNYKSFKERQELELKPITVLIGKNSSGKSAISRLLTLLSGSLSGEFDPPLKWENKGVRLGLSNSDLVYNRNTAANLLEFEIAAEEEELKIVVNIDSKDKPEILEWKLNDKEVSSKETLFKGFAIDHVPFKNLQLRYDYIGPIRKVPEANYANSFETFTTIGVDGANSYPILIQDWSDKKLLINQVSDWYRQNFEGWLVDIFSILAPQPTFQIVLSNKKISQVNIVNVGQGMTQALPLIVRSFMQDKENVRIIIEEPETHLHPAAHGNLAERFVDSFLSDCNKSYLIETHSQNFVLRLRRLVADKKLDIKDLAIYYVDFDEEINESSIKRINLTPDGGVEWWPDGMFSETLTETRAIRDAQLKGLQDVD
ncbi:AAA family ATPase [Chitinophaga sp. CF418]|uniref:AAA family ATPase n=1 Tax=Chitinophaga sp. CF418 TaxID=1855287 RepID=UPI000910372C|nr:AAA family ATPase [Chitinophaga sp. CF418]SHN45785.1 Predicted ATPase [Chitinophaga sp. CF418]